MRYAIILAATASLFLLAGCYGDWYGTPSSEPTSVGNSNGGTASVRKSPDLPPGTYEAGPPPSGLMQ